MDPPAATHSYRTTRWRDLAALLDPAGRCADPLADGRPLDWAGIYWLAASELVAPTLYAVLAARGRLDAVPTPVAGALAELHRLNAARNAWLRRVLRETIHHLNAAGIEPLLLKGALALLPGQYPQAAARMLGDLDLALVNAPAERGAAVLRAVGYTYLPDVDLAHYAAPHHHLAPLFHPDGGVYVELHRALLAAPLTALPLAQVDAATVPLDWDGLRLWVPSLGHRLLHNALHHQVQDAGLRAGRHALRPMLEFAYLRTLPPAAATDWPGLLAAVDATGHGEAVRAYLLAGERLFGQPLPAGVTPGRAAYQAERRAWFRVEHPRLVWLLDLARRLPNLPRHLVTPRWYRRRLREWRGG